MAKAAASLLAAVGNATRGFESFPSPPNSIRQVPLKRTRAKISDHL